MPDTNLEKSELAANDGPKSASAGHTAHSGTHGSWLLQAVTALGIVYGDIGTSPLYAFQVALSVTGHDQPTRADVIGIVSMIFWAVLLVVAILLLYCW